MPSVTLSTATTEHHETLDRHVTVGLGPDATAEVFVTAIQDALAYPYHDDLFDRAAEELAAGHITGPGVVDLRDHLNITLTYTG